MSSLFVTAAVVAILAVAAPARASTELACLTPSESREAIASEGLAKPARALREAVRHEHGDVLHSRLCRWRDELVYEITVLRHDGKVRQVFVGASNGLFVDIADH